MTAFAYHSGQLCAEGVVLAEIAKQFGTPCYVYSRSAIEQRWRAFDSALTAQKHLICYAVKANSNLAVLNVLARLGSGFDIVSIGELERVLKAGGDSGKVVFSGVGKKADEMQRALEVGIKCFNVESLAELDRLNRAAGALGKVAPVSLRVNLDVDTETHPYIATGLKENGETGTLPGVSFPYEAPKNANLVLATDQYSIDACTEKVIEMLAEQKVI